MKTLVATTMALGVVFMLGGSQSVSASVIQPIAPIYQNEQVIPVYWHYWHHWHPYWGHWGHWGHWHRWHPYWRHYW